jgi:hypothetical protein
MSTLVKECVYQQNVWFDEPPSFIIPLLVDDVSVLRLIKVLGVPKK